MEPDPPAERSTRVAHVVTRWDGGSAINISRWVAEEARSGRSVHVVVGPQDRTADPPHEATFLVCPWLKRDPSPVDDARALLWLLRFMKRIDPSIVHTHQAKAGALGRLAAHVCGVPLVVHTVHLPSFDASRRLHAALRWTERFLSRRTDLIYFVGQEMHDRHVRAGICGVLGSTVVRSPVPVQQFSATKPERASNRERVRRDLNIGPDDLVLVTAGTLEPRKRHRELIHALAAVHQDVVLLIAGSGALEQELRAEAASSSKRVELIGHRTDLEAVFHAADAYVHASALEGVPQVVVQAVAADLPVVALDSGGVREIPFVDVVPTVTDLVRSAVQNVRRPSDVRTDWSDELTDWVPTAVQKQLRRALADEDQLLSRPPSAITISGWVPEHTGLGVLRSQLITGLENRGVEVLELSRREPNDAVDAKERLKSTLRALLAAPGWNKSVPFLHVVPPLPALAGPHTVSVLADTRWLRTRGLVARSYRRLDLIHCYLTSRRVAAISRSAAEQFDTLMGSARPVSVVRLGGDHLPPRPRRHGAGGRVILIGAAPHKRNEAVLEALALARPPWLRGVDLVSVSAGAEAAASELVGVDVRRYRHISPQDLSELLADADVYIGLSEEEGFGLPWLEARRAGCAVLAPDCPVAREVLGEDATFLAPGLGVEPLATVFRELPTVDLARRAVGEVRSWDDCVDDVVSLLER